MAYRDSTAERTTITRNLDDLRQVTGNVYESIVVLSKRADQVNVAMKEELTSKLEEFASTTDNLEEIFENREQIEVSRFYERLPKPGAIAMQEFEEDGIFIRRPESK